MDNIGRNNPCPCGSGKKYKKCCLNKNKGSHLNKINELDYDLKRKEFVLNNNYNLIYLLSTNCIYDNKEEYIEYKGINHFIKLINKIRNDSRFKVSSVDKYFEEDYPHYEMLYLSSDCERLNRDYHIFDNIDFSDSIDLACYDIEIGDIYYNKSYDEQYIQYTKIVTDIDKFLKQIDWRKKDSKYIINSLKGYGITVLKDLWV